MQGATKDIQTLFTAIDRRIQALKRNVPSDSIQSDTDQSDPTTAILPDDEEDKDEALSSRQSSPDSSPEAVRVRPFERPPVISVTNADSDQRSQSSGQSPDKGSFIHSIWCVYNNYRHKNVKNQKFYSLWLSHCMFVSVVWWWLYFSFVVHCTPLKLSQELQQFWYIVATEVFCVHVQYNSSCMCACMSVFMWACVRVHVSMCM